MKTGFMFFLTITFLNTGAEAQSDYVVTIKGDTIKGEVLFLNVRGNIERLHLEIEGQKKKNFMATQLRSAFVDSSDIKIIKYLDKYRFMKVVASGYLNLLYFRADGSLTFNQVFLYKNDGEMTELPRLNFKSRMSDFVDECDDVAIKIKNRELKIGDLDKIIKEFNDCIDRKTLQSTNAVTQLAQPDLNDQTGDSFESKRIISNLRVKFKESNLPNTDFDEIMDDIDQKIDQGKKVPGYLIEALKESLQGSAELLELVSDLESSL